MSNTAGGAFLPNEASTVTGWTLTNPTITGATLTTTTLTSPTLTSPTITGTTSVGSGATLTSPTVTTPTVTGGTATGTTLASSINSDIKVLAASATYDANVVAATLTGFSWTVVPGTYVFQVNLPTTMTTNGGLALSFLLTTAVLTSIRYQTYAATAADNGTAVSTQGTTTTSTTKIFDSKTAAYTLVSATGSMVVGTGGTFAWQGCQNTSAAGADATIVLLGAYASMTRVA